MQSVTIHPGPIEGNLTAPASKSFSQRVMAALLARGGNLRVSNPGISADERVVRELLRDAGYLFSATEDGDLLIEAPEVRQEIAHADFGSSALAARMLTPLLALQSNIIRLEGSSQLRKRPLPFLHTWLPQLGVRVSATKGRLPTSIHGPLLPRDIQVDAGISSQAVSGLLLAYAASGALGKVIEVANLVSRQYVGLTLHVMELLGMLRPRNESYQRFVFPDVPCDLPCYKHVRIEGDWSGAAFLLVAGVLGGKLCIQGLETDSLQPDRRILEVLKECGAGVSLEAHQVCARAAGALQPFHFDATECPDLFPPLAALACYIPGTSSIQGVGRLHHKESNRAASITSELGKMGADIRIENDRMLIAGGTQLSGAQVHAQEDHRIAMMCAVAAIPAKGPVRIQNAQAVDKSYPHFYEALGQCGLHIAYGE